VVVSGSLLGRISYIVVCRIVFCNCNDVLTRVSLRLKTRYGVFSIFLRLCLTSFLIFFNRRVIKTMFATLAALVAVAVQLKAQPYLVLSDDKVAILCNWVVFAWVFSLQAFDALSSLPGGGLAWGTPLMLFTLWVGLYTFYLIAMDIRKDAAASDGAQAEVSRSLGGLLNQMNSLERSPMFAQQRAFLADLGDGREAGAAKRELKAFRLSVVELEAFLDTMASADGAVESVDGMAEKEPAECEAASAEKAGGAVEKPRREGGISSMQFWM
jgi:hypothetical protein